MPSNNDQRENAEPWLQQQIGASANPHLRDFPWWHIHNLCAMFITELLLQQTRTPRTPDRYYAQWGHPEQSITGSFPQFTDNPYVLNDSWSGRHLHVFQFR